ncbi:hypothetical protein ACO1O0_005670 [Amphichorda felina]
MLLSRLFLPLSLTNFYIAATLAKNHQPSNSLPGHSLSAAEVISLLSLEPTAEKGFLHETFRDAYHLPCAANRSASTAIYYLLTGAESFSLWHKVDQTEVWHYYAGAPLSLYMADDEGGGRSEVFMGADLAGGMRPQGVVPKDMWQRARSWGEWTLVGTTVAPGFEISGVIVKPEGWNPGDP